MSVSEQQLIAAFHALQAASLALARNEGLIDADTLSSFDRPEIQAYAPALTLTVAALRATGNPPAIEMPSIEPNGPTTLGVLTENNCPISLRPLLQRWSQLVPTIQAFDQAGVHELCRLLVDLPSSNPNIITDELHGVATSLRALALEIGQRRTFQTLFSGDIQAALDYESRRTGAPARKANFQPPPVYADEGPSLRPRIDTNMADDNIDPVLQSIRETLYAALAEVLTTSPKLLAILFAENDDRRPRAYFAAVALALLFVCLNQVDPVHRAVRVVSIGPGSPALVTEDTSPAHLKGIVGALCGISTALRRLRDADDTAAVEWAVAGNEGESTMPTQIERLKTLLEDGAGPANEISNAINALALRIQKLPQFVAKQAEVFAILTGLPAASPDTMRRIW